MKAGQHMVVSGSYSCTQHTCLSTGEETHALLGRQAFGCCSARQNVPILILHGLSRVWGEMFSLAVCKCRHPTLA